MKKTIFIALICFANVVVAAAQEGWSVGVIANPSYYWLYNQNDFTAERPVMYPVNPSAPNSFTGGAEIAYNFAENFGVKSGLNYSTNLQKYGAGTEEYRKTNTIVDYSSQLNYLQLPILFTANTTHDDDENRLSLFGEVGIVNAFLLSYKETINLQTINDPTEYGLWTDNNGTVNYDYFRQNATFTSGVYSGDWFYNRFDISLYGGLGLRYFINENIGIDLRLNGQYGLLNTDNLTGKAINDSGIEFQRWYDSKSTKYQFTIIRGVNDNTRLSDRQATHNIKTGITIGVSYHFTE
jgi:Outer membrane protein beta-barrel domain